MYIRKKDSIEFKSSIKVKNYFQNLARPIPRIFSTWFLCHGTRNESWIPWKHDISTVVLRSCNSKWQTKTRSSQWTARVLIAWLIRAKCKNRVNLIIGEDFKDRLLYFIFNLSFKSVVIFFSFFIFVIKQYNLIKII